MSLRGFIRSFIRSIEVVCNSNVRLLRYRCITFVLKHRCTEQYCKSAQYNTVHNDVLSYVYCRTVRICYIAKLRQATRGNWILNMLNSNCFSINSLFGTRVRVHLRGERKTTRPAVQRSAVFVLSFHMTSSVTFNWMRSCPENSVWRCVIFEKIERHDVAALTRGEIVTAGTLYQRA